MNESEIWKPVVGHENFYHVSDLGLRFNTHFSNAMLICNRKTWRHLQDL